MRKYYIFFIQCLLKIAVLCMAILCFPFLLVVFMISCFLGINNLHVEINVGNDKDEDEKKETDKKKGSLRPLP